MARFVGSAVTRRDPYWGLKSTRDGLESGTEHEPCGTASGVGMHSTGWLWGWFCVHAVGELWEGRTGQQSELIDGKEGIPSHPQSSSCLFSLGTSQ